MVDNALVDGTGKLPQARPTLHLSLFLLHSSVLALAWRGQIAGERKRRNDEQWRTILLPDRQVPEEEHTPNLGILIHLPFQSAGSCCQRRTEYTGRANRSQNTESRIRSALIIQAALIA